MSHTFITCSFCGKREDLEAFRLIHTPLVAKMRGEQLCFDCSYWKLWLSNPEPNTIVASGNLYKQTSPLIQPSLMQSRNKDMKFLLEISTRKAYGCTGLTLRGRIPPQFSRQLPNQYQLISREVYKRIREFNAEMCLSKGCFDRYHCLWYNAAVAEPDEPWNTIPKNYKIGSEDCPSFVNKYDLRND